MNKYVVNHGFHGIFQEDKMKKSFVVVLLALSMIFSIIACAAAEDVTEIVLWTALSGSKGQAIQQVVDNFNNSQDKIHVTAEYQGNYYEIAAKLQAGLASGDTPNITMMSGSRVKRFAELGAFVDCTDLFPKHGIDLHSFYDGFWFQLDWGEGQFGVPFNCSTPLFYYNKEMFEAAGLPDRGPANWDELAEFARKLTNDETIGYEMPLDVWFYECFIIQQGLPLLNEDETDIGFNNADGAAPLYSWIDMMKEGIMSFPPGQEYNSYDQARLDFSSRKAAMILASTGDLATLNDSCDFEVGTAFLPAGKQYGTSGGGTHMLPVVGHEDELDASLEFLAFATSPEQAGLFAALTGYIPTSPAAAESEVYQKYLAEVPNAAVALEQMPYAQTIPVNTYYAQIKDDIITTEIQRIFEEENFTPEDALNAISEQTRQLLAEGN